MNIEFLGARPSRQTAGGRWPMPVLTGRKQHICACMAHRHRCLARQRQCQGARQHEEEDVLTSTRRCGEVNATAARPTRTAWPPESARIGCVAIAPLIPKEPRWPRSSCSFTATDKHGSLQVLGYLVVKKQDRLLAERGSHFTRAR